MQVGDLLISMDRHLQNLMVTFGIYVRRQEALVWTTFFIVPYKILCWLIISPGLVYKFERVVYDVVIDRW